MANFSHTPDHERTDAHVRPVAMFLVFMFSSVLAAYGVITLLIGYFEQRHLAKYGNPVQFAVPESAAPKLQVVPGLDVNQIRAEEAEQLEGYGWVDQNRGVAHVPIEQAIDMLLERGVAARGVVVDAPVEEGAATQGAAAAE